jgi:hypothetical protein
MIVRLWLEWRVDRSWLPPPNALTPGGERLWRMLYRITVWGFLIWLALVAIWFI